MKLDVLNGDNQKVGSVDLDDAVFAGPVKLDLVWESVVRQNAAARRGTHKAKSRGQVSGTGKKPYPQKGTGRPQVGSSRTPLWRHGGTVFPPQPRSYAYQLPKKVEKGALRAALTAKLRESAVMVVDELKAAERKTKPVVEMLRRLELSGKTVFVDIAIDDNFQRSARNITGVRVVASAKLTARDVMDARRVVLTRAAAARLQEVLA